MDTARMLTVIETTARRGSGECGDPIRVVTRYWTTDGKLLFEIDPGRENARSDRPAPERALLRQ